MEHIIDTTPQGSAILAYGKAPKSWGFLKWVLIGLIALIALFLFGIWMLVRSISVELPENRLLLVALKPSEVRSAIPGGLIPDLPPAWRAAIRTDSSLPIYFGLSLDDVDEPHAFALVYRHHIVVESDDLRVTTRGLTKLLEDTSSNTNRDRVRGSELLKLSRELRSHDASWKLESYELTRFILNEGVTNDAVFGIWDGRRGSIELPSTDVPSIAEFDAPIIVTLGSDRMEAEPVTNALASQGIDLRSVGEPPSVIFISPEEGDVRLGWEGSVSPSNQKLVLGALGIASLKEYRLPDETIVREIAPSVDSISSVSGSLFSSEGISGISHSDTWPEDCPGTLRLSLGGSVLQNLLESWRIPRSWREYISSIQIREAGKRANICVN